MAIFKYICSDKEREYYLLLLTLESINILSDDNSFLLWNFSNITNTIQIERETGELIYNNKFIFRNTFNFMNEYFLIYIKESETLHSY